MSDTATATLPAYEGRKVKRATVRITDAGDGLSEALKIEPKVYHIDDEVFFVLRGKISQVNHKANAKDDQLERVHTVKAAAIVEVDRADVQAFLEVQAEKERVAKDNSNGQGNILDVPGVKRGTPSPDDD